MKEQQSVQFKINNKEFHFIIEEEQKVVEDIKNIINEVSEFVEQQNKGMFGVKNFAYIIFILASNLARLNSQNQNKDIVVDEGMLQTEIKQMMEKVSFLSDSIKEQTKM